MNFNRLDKLSNLVTNDIKRKPIVILEPNLEKSFRIVGSGIDIRASMDADEWKVPEELKSYIQELGRSKLSIEEKIISIYAKICEEYTYDDNVLSYIKKNDDDTFFLPDAYGRRTNSKWRENRKKHTRRVCFEISRILAKSMKEVLRLSKAPKNYDICILWDEAVTHYFVGFVSNDYCISLDLDDFLQIKDITRIKTGLTLEGIKILDDPSQKFKTVLDRFNKGRSKIAKDHIQSEKQRFNQRIRTSIPEDEYQMLPDEVQFLQYAIQILKEKYELDSAGIYEYMKEIVDTKIGARSRKKVWKKVENEPGQGTRYTRCLIVTIDDVSYLIDVTKDDLLEMFREFDFSELDDKSDTIIPFNKMERNWDVDEYDGR